MHSRLSTSAWAVGLSNSFVIYHVFLGIKGTDMEEVDIWTTDFIIGAVLVVNSKVQHE